MAFKMKGAPMHDLSSKHGTNTNYKKSGAPGLLGKILDPLGLKKKIFGGKGGNCPPAQGAQPAAPAPDAPAQPAAPAPAAAAAPPEEAAAPTTMKKGLKNGAPKKEVVQGGVKPTVNVSGGKKTTFDDNNRVMTKGELVKAKINPQPGTTYYKNKKTGRVSTATKPK